MSTVANGLEVQAFHRGSFLNLPSVVNTKQNDYNLWVISSDSAWINSNVGGHADLRYLFGPDDAKPAAPVAAPAKQIPVATRTESAPAVAAPNEAAISLENQVLSKEIVPNYTVVLGSFKSYNAAAQYIQDLKGKLPVQSVLKINQASGKYRVGTSVPGPKNNALVALNDFRQLVPAAWLTTELD